MHPTRTIYRLADTVEDMAACARLLGRQETLDWPVVVAERDGAVIGCASASLQRDIVQLGHLLTTPGPHAALTCLRLVEAWENVLAAAGVSEYFFGVEHDNATLMALVEQLGMRPHSQLEHLTWYKRCPSRIQGDTYAIRT